MDYYRPVFKDRTKRPGMFHGERDRRRLENVQLSVKDIPRKRDTILMPAEMAEESG